MRLISQDGRVDWAYDSVMVEIEPDKKCDILLTTPEMAAMGQAFTAAEYSTPEKAKKVMNRLHNVYRDHQRAAGRVVGKQFYAPEFRYNPPKIFKFPEDSEV